jgi:CysZ protein
MELPAGGAPRFGAGLELPFRGLAYLAGRRELWRYAVLPVLFTVAGVIAAVVSSVPLSGWLLGLVWTRPESWLVVLWILARIAVGLAVVVALALALPVVVSAPFADRLSARVEELELGAPDAGGLRQAVAETWRGLSNALSRGVRLLVGLVLLLPALLVPGLYPVLAFLWTARWTAVEWLDLPMARHLHHVSDVRAALRAVRPMGFTFGAVLTLALAVPLANFLVVPVGAVSGTLLYCDLVRAGVVVRGAAPASRPAGAAPAA